jgi:hypothetical protein
MIKNSNNLKTLLKFKKFNKNTFRINGNYFSLSFNTLKFNHFHFIKEKNYKNLTFNNKIQKFNFSMGK